MSEQEMHHVVILRRRRCRAAADPVEQIGVIAFEQRLVAVELTGIEIGEMGLGEMAENEVGLARPAVPRPE